MFARFRFGRDRVVKQLPNRVRWHTTQFLHAAVTGEPAGVAHQLSEPRMIGMLVFDQARRQHDAGPHAPNDAGQFDGVGGADFEMRIAVQFDKFNRCAE